jgi:ferrochelatase
MSDQRLGVLMMAYGTPGSRSEVEAYYARIRHGHAPSPEQLADLVRRYDAIGGISPLRERTAAQVRGLAVLLEQLEPNRFDVRFGAKYSEPSIEATMASFDEDGVTSVIALALTPHRSSMGSGEYLERASAAQAPGGQLARIEQFYDTEGFTELIAGRVREALAQLGADEADRAMVLFSAHSLPARILDQGDPYPEQLTSSAARVAELLGLERFEVAYQSAGRTRDPWLGPDITEVIAELPERGISSVVVCPIGFVADHLEVLYDIDVEAAAIARAAGVHLVRTASLNDDPAFLAVLARAIRSIARGL